MSIKANVRYSKDALVQAADSLPGSARVLSELRQLLDNPAVEMGAIAGLLRKDGLLTSRLISLANGLVFNRGGERVASIEEALTRVGVREVYRLVSAISMTQFAEIELQYYPISGKAFRENALLCAMLMEALARECGQNSQMAYTAGLMRSVGRVILDVTAQHQPRSATPAVFGTDGLITWEIETFGCTSGEAATVALQHWRFPIEVIVAVRDQFLHNLVVDPLPLAKLLHISIDAAGAAGYGLAGVRFGIEKTVSQARAELGLSADTLTTVCQRVVGEFETAKSILG